MPTSHGRRFGTCRCSGHFNSVEVEIRMDVTDPEPVTLENVPQGSCTSCGSRVYKAEMLERIEAVFKGEPRDPGMSTFAL